MSDVGQLLRSAEAIDTLLVDLKVEVAASFLPARKALDEAFTIRPSVLERVTEYIREFAASSEEVEPESSEDTPSPTEEGIQASVVTELAPADATRMLAEVERVLRRLLDDIRWSGSISGFSWWLQHRLNQYGLDECVVVVGPGTASDFHIDPMPAVGTRFGAVQAILLLKEDEVSKLAKIRTLRLPEMDGTNLEWHPISLGHEVAHLVFDAQFVEDVLAALDHGKFEQSASHAIQLAAGGTVGKGGSSHLYYEHLLNWLQESLCDLAAKHLYGSAAVRALEDFLEANSVEDDTEHHPGPLLRLAVLRDPSAVWDAQEHRPDPAVQLGRRETRLAYLQLVETVLAAGAQKLAELNVVVDGRDAIVADAVTALDAYVPPATSGWPAAAIQNNPSMIEAGLVEAYWSMTGKLMQQDLSLAADPKELRDATVPVSRRLGQALNSLHFSHEFLNSAAAIQTDTDERPPTSVLWLTSDGVTSARDGTIHTPSADLRLGRHFIVFRRNHVSALNSLSTVEIAKRVQERVEISWGGEFTLHPGEMVLAVTLEHLVLDHTVCAQVLSRSSVGRLGLLSATAVQVQPNFRGCLTLELVNLASVPLIVSPGQRVAQIVPIPALGTSPDDDGKYQDQGWLPQFSKVHTDKDAGVLTHVREQWRAGDVDV